MTIARILGLAAKAGSRTKLGRKKPFKYHFVKGTTSFEAESSYGTSVLGNKVFSYTMKSRKTPATKLKARLTKAASKKISPKYRDFGVYIDKIKTVPASKLKTRLTKAVSKKISPRYRDFGINIEKIKTVPASKRRAVKRFKKTIHKSPTYKGQERSLMEMRDDMAFNH